MWDQTAAPLQARFVRLEPYAERLKEELKTALDCDPDTWAIFSRPGFGEHFEMWWSDSIKNEAAGTSRNFVIRQLSDQSVVGTTSLLNLRPTDRVAEIGATFIRPEVRSGAVNPEAKRLMLAHAFEGGLFEAPANRIELMVDVRNARSQAAVLKLGALSEGVLRKNKVTWTGHVRDTRVFSIIADEWPAVRQGLDARISALADQPQT